MFSTLLRAWDWMAVAGRACTFTLAIVMLTNNTLAARGLVLTVAEPSRAFFSEGQSADLPATSVWTYARKSIVNNESFFFFASFFLLLFLKKKKWRDNLFVLFFLFCCGSKSFSKNFQACSYTYQPNTFTPAIVFNALTSDGLNGCCRRRLHSFARYCYANA